SRSHDRRWNSWRYVCISIHRSSLALFGRTSYMREVIDLSREYLGRVYLAVAKRIWYRLPGTWHPLSPVVAYGTHINAVVRRFEPRRQNHSTFFFRNRPELTLMTRFLEHLSHGARLEI